ncbi:NAD(P)-binding protein [Nitrincola alkalilacustris]|uniref:NAD(P)-binding protein n=1 Tax=Nitrincola alkalilacustris TaxID=1571224 RepID=UPI00124D452F|nr:NAD(P)-binding protein [Nitrincola alkalilacustris]
MIEPSVQPTLQIAVIGSGPSGCYIADILSKKLPSVQIDLFERLPTPFGLVRAGVAPDHQITKQITRQLDRTLQLPNVRFIGHVEIGQNLSYDELKQHYHLVIAATGALQDRQLGIPGESLQGDQSSGVNRSGVNITGVYGSGAFACWYNAHPDQAELAPHLGRRVAIIGNGNVALDIVRILAKSPAEMASSDIDPTAEQTIRAAGIEEIYLIGRRGPLQASFTPMELKEIGELEQCAVCLDKSQLPDTVPEEADPKDRIRQQKNLDLLHEFASRETSSKPVRLHLLFQQTPVRLKSDQGRLSALELKKTVLTNGHPTDEPESPVSELPLDTLISAIGYRSVAIQGMPFDEKRGIISNLDGRVEPGVYTLGWSQHGPQGVIPNSRVDAMTVAKKIMSDLQHHPVTAPVEGFDAISALLEQRGVRPLSYADWQKIDAAETARATAGKPREKFRRLDQLIAAAK